MMPQELFRLIQRFEGLRLKPYLCPAGIPTIGYGCTRYPDGRGVTLSDSPISTTTAMEMLAFEAAQFMRQTLILSPVLATHEGRLSAITDFCYNLGTTRYKASTLRRKVNAQDWEGAAQELSKWVWGGGKKLPGLVLRRAAEAQLLKG
jgi:lysozyme